MNEFGIYLMIVFIVVMAIMFFYMGRDGTEEVEKENPYKLMNVEARLLLTTISINFYSKERKDRSFALIRAVKPENIDDYFEYEEKEFHDNFDDMLDDTEKQFGDYDWGKNGNTIYIQKQYPFDNSIFLDDEAIYLDPYVDNINIKKEIITSVTLIERIVYTYVYSDDREKNYYYLPTKENLKEFNITKDAK